jgi:hypothetical protein
VLTTSIKGTIIKLKLPSLEFKEGIALKAKYKFLAGKLFDKGLKKNAVARKLGITPRALNNKIYGIAPFTWEQACTLQQKFFPEIPLEILFKETDSMKQTKK